MDAKRKNAIRVPPEMYNFKISNHNFKKTDKYRVLYTSLVNFLSGIPTTHTKLTAW